jgi:hypothetical protein
MYNLEDVSSDRQSTFIQAGLASTSGCDPSLVITSL